VKVYMMTIATRHQSQLKFSKN